MISILTFECCSTFKCGLIMFKCMIYSDLISLAGYSNEASFWLCQDCTLSWERLGLVWHRHNHVRFLILLTQLILTNIFWEP